MLNNIRARIRPPTIIPVKSIVRIKGGFKRGGKVKSSGAYMLHKNELVIPASKAKKVKTLMTKNNIKLKTK
tara:strand:+ start:1141 stop:1353 length:213 start_codon:yes stop_codon:yes gene_type:complete